MPDPEVPERPVRRPFTAEYKLRIVEAANAATEPGQVGALLRREGLIQQPEAVHRLTRGIRCDNAETLVARVLRGRDRPDTDRFIALRSQKTTCCRSGDQAGRAWLPGRFGNSSRWSVPSGLTTRNRCHSNWEGQRTRPAAAEVLEDEEAWRANDAGRG